MRLVDYIQSCELEPNLPDGTVVDREEVGRLMAGEAATRSETKLARALTEQLYPLVLLSSDESIAFTCPSRVFLVETANRSEIKFDADRAPACLVVDLRAEVENEYETMLALLEKDQCLAR